MTRFWRKARPVMFIVVTLCLSLSVVGLAVASTGSAVLKTHTVTEGDTLSHIADKYGTTAAAIARQNGIELGTVLKIGRVLQIPVRASQTGAGSNQTAEGASAESFVVHTIARGDTLSGLASKYRTTVLAIAEANDMDVDDTLVVGKDLKMPGVKKADKAETPAQAQDNSQLAQAAALAQPSAPVSVAAQSAAPVVKAAPQAPAPPPQITHRIVSGDTLSRIASKYGTTILAIANLNGIGINQTLHVGNTLRIPGKGNATEDATAKAVPASVERRRAILASRDSRTAVAVPWDEVNEVFARGEIAKITDVETGQSFMIKRHSGTLHADVEPLTKQDADIMKKLWGGWKWDRRSVVFEYRGYRIAASMNAMPHGTQSIRDNGITGHVCLHFLNSRLHCNRRIDPEHQAEVKAAIGK